MCSKLDDFETHAAQELIEIFLILLFVTLCNTYFITSCHVHFSNDGSNVMIIVDSDDNESINTD